MHPKLAPQTHFRRRHCSPQALSWKPRACRVTRVQQSAVPAGYAPETCAASALSSQASQRAGFSANRNPRILRHARSSKRNFSRRYIRSSHRKRIFAAGIAVHRLQCKQKPVSMSRHARSPKHSFRRVCTRSPHRKLVFVAGIAARRLQHKQ